MKSLYLLGAIDCKGRLTKLGKEISKFPLEPNFTKALLFAYLLGEQMKRRAKREEKHSHFKNVIVDDMLKVVSMMSCENIWMNVSRFDSRTQQSMSEVKKKFRDIEGDHF